MYPNAVVMVVVAAIIWGMIGPLTHLFRYSVSMYAAVRLIIPAVILYVGFAIRYRRIFWFKYTPKLAMISALNIVRVGLFFYAISLAPISYIIFFLYLWPIFAIFLAVPILKEKWSNWGIGLGLLAVTGSLMMQIPYGFHWQSALLHAGIIMVISAFTNAISVVMITQQRATYSPMEVIFYQNGFGAVLGMMYLAVSRPSMTLFDAGYLSAYGFMIGIVSFSLYYGALRAIDTKTASLLSYIELLVAFSMGVTVLHERVYALSLLGGAVILVAVLLSFRLTARRDPVPFEQ